MQKQYNYSIIIPHYNIPDLLVRCIESIPNRNDIQIIVVDDNSPGCNNYLKEISALSRPNLEFYITRDKKGAGHARNVALPHIKGKKVLFADADDLFVDDFSDILDQYIDDDSDIVFFNTKGAYSDDLSRNSNRNKNKLFADYEKSGDINIFRYRYTEPWGKIFNAQLIQKYRILFDETIVANDQMFSVKTGVFANKIKAVNRPLYIVTVREGSLSYKSLDTKEKMLARFYVMARVQVFLKNYGYCENDMLIFPLSVNLLHRYPLTFVKKIFWLKSLGIDIKTLIVMIYKERIMNSSKRKKLDIFKESYR